MEAMAYLFTLMVLAGLIAHPLMDGNPYPKPLK